VVRKGTYSKEVELEYIFDRLASKRVVQVYRLLVPEKIRATDCGVDWFKIDCTEKII